MIKIIFSAYVALIAISLPSSAHAASEDAVILLNNKVDQENYRRCQYEGLSWKRDQTQFVFSTCEITIIRAADKLWITTEIVTIFDPQTKPIFVEATVFAKKEGLNLREKINLIEVQPAEIIDYKEAIEGSRCDSIRAHDYPYNTFSHHREVCWAYTEDDATRVYFFVTLMNKTDEPAYLGLVLLEGDTVKNFGLSGVPW